MNYRTQTNKGEKMNTLIGLMFPAVIGWCVANSLWNQISDVLASLTAIL